VLITTKAGRESKPTISYKTYTGVESRIDNLDVMNAEQWANIYNEGRVNDGNAIEPTFADPSSLESYNWKDAAYRSGNIQSHQLAISGGSKKSTYYVSFGKLDQKGILNNTLFKRTNFRVNNTYQIKPKIKVGQNVQYSNSKSNSVTSSGGNSNLKTAFVGYIVDPVSLIYNEDGSPARPLNSTEIRNPVGLTLYEQTPLTKESFLGNVFIEADLLKGLSFRSNYGLEINNRKTDNYQEAYYISAEQNRLVNKYTLLRSENRVSVWSNTLSYNKTINEKHSINALLGHESQDSDYNNIIATRSSIPEGVENPTLSAGAVDTSTNSGSISSSSLLSFFGRFNYSYDNRYLLTGTFRVDGSSRFGENNRFAQFPSLALAWNIHKEDFFNIDAMNQFKFRVGWGETGNQNIPNSAIFSTLSTSENYLLGDDETTVVGLAPLRPGNPDLKWETTTTTNVGLDLAFLDNSITFTADYFIKTTSDMLLESPILETSGYSSYPTINAGEIENKGL
jgi:TonB-linked SusC/RagA family outer membrane protein